MKRYLIIAAVAALALTGAATASTVLKTRTKLIHKLCFSIDPRGGATMHDLDTSPNRKAPPAWKRECYVPPKHAGPAGPVGPSGPAGPPGSSTSYPTVTLCISPVKPHSVHYEGGGATCDAGDLALTVLMPVGESVPSFG